MSPTVQPSVMVTGTPTHSPTEAADEGENGAGTELLTRAPTPRSNKSSAPVIVGSIIGACALFVGIFSAFYMRKAKHGDAAPTTKKFSEKLEDEDDRLSVNVAGMMTANPLHGTSRPEPLQRYTVGEDDTVLPLGPFDRSAIPKMKKQFPGDL